MTLTGIIGIIIIALLLGMIFFFLFDVRGPWGSFWTFFLVLILTIGLVAFWVEPVGPVFWGVAWIDLFVFGLLFALLLAAATPPADRSSDMTYVEEERGDRPVTTGEKTSAVVGGIFWTMLLLFVVVIIAGILVA